jgi:hypothetical protein
MRFTPGVSGESAFDKGRDVKWHNEGTGEIFIHREREDGSRQLFFGQPDVAGEKKHGHAELTSYGTPTYLRPPKGEPGTMVFNPLGGAAMAQAEFNRQVRQGRGL